MNPKPRNIPEGTSPLGRQPKLTPSTGPLKVGDSSAPEPEPETTAPQSEEPAPTLREPTSRPSTQIGRRPPPVARGAVTTTVRFDPEEAAEVDQFLLDLRLETGERLDKAELIRELLRLARFHPQTRKTLVTRLRN